jgi:hypothetical protein
VRERLSLAGDARDVLSARDSVIGILGIRPLATKPPETGSRDEQSEKIEFGELNAIAAGQTPQKATTEGSRPNSANSVATSAMNKGCWYLVSRLVPERIKAAKHSIHPSMMAPVKAPHFRDLQGCRSTLLLFFSQIFRIHILR